jgi:hypothetical protein
MLLTRPLELMCSAKPASTVGLVRMPSFTISSAPPFSPWGGPSSAGWKMNFTVPGRSAFIADSTSATPMRIATWVS